jgi:DNA primase
MIRRPSPSPRSGLDDVKGLPILDVAQRLGIVAGTRGSARCPFPGHHDANPSFSFYPATNTCWCHGCARGGDVINLVAHRQNWSAGQAIRWLRDTYGMQVGHALRSIRPAPSVTLVDRIQPAHVTSDFAPSPEIYEALLQENPLGPEAADYLSGRGFSDATIKHFRLGSLVNAPASARVLVQRFGHSAVHKAGLINGAGSNIRLVLPGRSVLFPFFDDDRVVYIQTRILPVAGGQGPRWMSPNGINKPVYNVNAIRESSSIYVCEGATDVLSAHELKLSAIGLLGGASRLPEHLLRALRGRRVLVVPDADDVGGRMSATVLADCRRRGIQCVIKPLSVGKDVNEYLLLSRHRK